MRLGIAAAVSAVLLVQAIAAREILPPEAYINRTLYPPVLRYPIKPQLSLGILSDVQYADQEEFKRRHFRKSLEKLDHAVKEMNANRTHLDMVIHLGDLIDHTMEKYLPVVEPILKQLRYPLFQLLGNHDFLNTAETKFGDIHKMLGMPARYYSLTAGPGRSYRLVMLDGNDIALYSTRSGSPERLLAYKWKALLRQRRRKNGQKFNGALGEQQIEWMKQQLSEACNASQRVFIFMHHPVRPVGEPTNLWNDLEVVPIITAYPCVVAVFNGHAHKFLYDFHHTKFRDVHFVTFGGMVQSPFTSWGLIDVYEKVLHVHGLVFGRAISFHYDISTHAATARDLAASAVDTAVRNPVEVTSVAPVSSSTPGLVERALERVRYGRSEDVTSDVHDGLSSTTAQAIFLTSLSVLLGVWLMRFRRRRRG
jgi:hypothetical protein